MGINDDLTKEIARAVHENKGEGLLLSGGLDSSIIAYHAPQARAVTVSLDGQGEDRLCAALIARHLGLDWRTVNVTAAEAIAALPDVIKVLKTFDPALPNDLAAHFGIKAARELGCGSVMTGDGGDELFAGYGYMLALDLKEYIPKIARTMSFSSTTLGKALGVEVRQPYLDRRFVEFAVGIDPALNVEKTSGATWGKFILRRAYMGMLPESILWRRKTPLELGSGFTALRGILETKLSDRELEEAGRRYGIKFRSKEHLYYYEIYRSEEGEIPGPKGDEKACTACGGGMPVRSKHCRICGAYPV